MTTAQTALVDAHSSYAINIASRMVRQAGRCDRDELVSAALWGLLSAAQRFDPGKGVQFLTFAHRHITGRVWDAIRLERENNGWSRSTARRGHTQRMTRVDWPNPIHADDTVWEPSTPAPDYDTEIALEQAAGRIASSYHRAVFQRLRAGETVTEIARRHGVTTHAICQVRDRAFRQARQSLEMSA